MIRDFDLVLQNSAWTFEEINPEFFESFVRESVTPLARQLGAELIQIPVFGYHGVGKPKSLNQYL